MNACWSRISLTKNDGIAIWTVRWVKNEETSWKDFPEVIWKIKKILECWEHHWCRNKSECSISRLHQDWNRWTLALI